MGQQSKIIYVDGKGFIPIQSGQTVQDAIAAAGGDGSNELSIQSPAPGQASVGFKMPSGELEQGPEGSGGPEDIIRAFPQIAGLIAMMTPMGRAGRGAMATRGERWASYGADAGVPALVDMATRALQGEDLDVGSAVQQGAIGTMARPVGAVARRFARGGEGMVRRSLGLTDGDEVLEQEIPKRLIKEKAEMSIPGVAKLREKVDATKDPWLKESADALAKARYKANNSPNLNAGGLMSMAGDVLLPPERQFGVGSAVAAPFGVSTEKYLAPIIEGLARIFGAYMSMPESGAASEQPSGPRRRSQQ